MGFTSKTVSESFEVIIVGFKLVSKRNNYNGDWDIKFNPLLKKEINITFTSQFIRVEKYMIYIYLMRFPD